MTKPRGKQAAPLQDADEEWVACTGCRTVVLLQSTPYSNRKEADEAQSYDCVVCVRLRLLEKETEWEAQKARKEWTQRLQALEAQIAAERKEFDKRQEELQSLLQQ